MHRKSRRRWLRAIAVASIVLLVLAGAVAIAVWRFAAASLSVDAIRPYIESTVESSLSGLEVEFDRLEIRWGGWRRGIDVVASETRITTGDFTATVPELVLKLSLRALFQLRIAPSEVDLVGVSGKLLRDENGAFRLAAVAAGRERVVDPDALDNLLATLGGPPDPTRPLSYLRHLRLRDADFDLEDRMLDTNWKAERIDIELHAGTELIAGLFRAAIVLDDANATADVEGTLVYVEEERLIRIEATAIEVPFDSIAVRFSAVQSRLRLRSSIATRIKVSLSLDGLLRDASFEFSGSPGQLGVTDWFDTPEAILGIDGRGRYDAATSTWEIDEFNLRFGDLEAYGPTFHARLTVTLDVTSTSIDADVAVDDFPVADIPRFWPVAIATGTRRWLAENITDGVVERADIKVALALARAEAVAATRLTRLSGRLSFDDVSVRWSDKRPRVTGISGTGTIAANALHFTVTRGHVGTVEVDGASVDLTRLDKPPVHLRLDIDGSGPVGAALEAVALNPPGFIGSLAPQDSPDARAEFKATVVAFSLGNRIEFDDLDIAVEAIVYAVPVAWSLASGHAGGRLTFASAQGDRRLRGTVDIGGLTSSLPFLGWHKLAGETGSARFDLSLGSPGIKALHRFDIATTSLEASGSAMFVPASDKLHAIDFTALRVHRTQPRSARIVWEDGGIHVAAVGGSVDLQPSLNAPEAITRSAGAGEALTVELMDVAILQLSSDGWLEHVSGSLLRDPAGLRRLALTGRVPASLSRRSADESRDVRLQMAPATADTLRAQLDSDDFGGLASVMGWTKAIYGGSLQLVIPDLPRTSIAGTVRVDAKDFRVRDTPLAVRLLGMASLDSLVSVMQGEALHFERLRGNVHVTNEELRVEELRAHGSSLGWRAQGTIERATGGLHIDGVLIPAYAANRILKAVPVLREVLVGEGLFAVDFHLRGTFAEPEIDVDAMSALTPELLRGIFGYPDARR